MALMEQEWPQWARSDQKRVEGNLVAGRLILLFPFHTVPFFFKLGNERHLFQEVLS